MKLDYSKKRKKSFKKYLMSLGFSRDVAERGCKWVACNKGSVSYRYFFNLVNHLIYWSQPRKFYENF